MTGCSGSVSDVPAVSVGSDERAVGPVVGVVLLIAIAAILAGVVGSFAYGLWNEKNQPAPQVQFTYEYDDGTNELTITHANGDTFERKAISFIEEGEGEIPDSDVVDDWPTDVTASASVTIENVEADDEIRILWKAPDEPDMTAILDTWEGPDA